MDFNTTEPFPDFDNTVFEFESSNLDNALLNQELDPMDLFTNLGPGMEADQGAIGVSHETLEVPNENGFDALNETAFDANSQLPIDEFNMDPLNFDDLDKFNFAEPPAMGSWDPMTLDAPDATTDLCAPGLEVFDQLNFPGVDPTSSQADDNSLFLNEGETDFSDPNFGNFRHASPTALPAPHSPIEPRASVEEDDRSRYAHFSVPIDTLPEPSDSGDEADSPVTLPCGITLNRLPRVLNRFPVLEEVGWHPGQPLPILSSTSFSYPAPCAPMTPPRQTARPGCIPATPMAPKRDSEFIDAEYERLTQQHNRQKAAKQKSVRDLNRTTRDAVKAVQRQAAKRYSAITGRPVTRLPRQRQTITARGGDKVKATISPAAPIRTNGSRKAKWKRQYVEEDSESDLTEFQGESDDTSAGDASSGDESEDEPYKDFGFAGGNRKHAMKPSQDVRRSKRLCRSRH